MREKRIDPDDTPQQRLFRWGDWGMVFGEPEATMFGSPTFFEPVDKDRWDRVMSGEFEGEGDERGPEWFETARKGKA